MVLARIVGADAIEAQQRLIWRCFFMLILLLSCNGQELRVLACNKSLSLNLSEGVFSHNCSDIV